MLFISTILLTLTACSICHWLAAPLATTHTVFIPSALSAFGSLPPLVTRDKINNRRVLLIVGVFIKWINASCWAPTLVQPSCIGQPSCRHCIVCTKSNFSYQVLTFGSIVNQIVVFRSLLMLLLLLRFLESFVIIWTQDALLVDTARYLFRWHTIMPVSFRNPFDPRKNGVGVAIFVNLSWSAIHRTILSYSDNSVEYIRVKYLNESLQNYKCWCSPSSSRPATSNV